MTRKTLYYTFGNHMHWVDMQWLWGYGVLPGSTEDAAHLISQTGVRGNLNFDAVGYERLAAESPSTLVKLRGLAAKGSLDPVGASYGQPYGLFHGLESNIRQLAFGVAAAARLIGVRPRAFWEEEYYFFCQLPQLLVKSGYDSACLFFQWTWHTPELPREEASLVRWRGIDGSVVPALPRNDLNVHQWPEDFDGLLEQGLIDRLERPAIVQWLELMPTRDWMCRSEVLLPRLKALFEDERFDLQPRTVAQLVAELSAAEPDAPVREYHPDQTWHGMTLGKNADRHPRTSRRVERLILRAEALAATASLFGRPYASWDVYPSWELDEAWRLLLAAQHHDNHECEGLCGHIGYHQMAHAESLAGEVLRRTGTHLACRAGGVVACRGDAPLGAFGAPAGEGEHPPAVDRPAAVWDAWLAEPPALLMNTEPVAGAIEARVEPDPLQHGVPGVRLVIDVRSLPRPKPGLVDALRLRLRPRRAATSVRAASPGAVRECRGSGEVQRKYPTGDWMTSPQWFETVRGAVTADCAMSVHAGEADGFCVLRDAAFQVLLDADGEGAIDIVLDAYDPWDEQRYDPMPTAEVVLAGAPRTDARLVAAAEAAFTPAVRFEPERLSVGGGDPTLGEAVPESFEPVRVLTEGVRLTAFRRASAFEGERFESWAGHALRELSGGSCTHPFVVRLCEYDGRAATAEVVVPGPIAGACVTDLLGETNDANAWLQPSDFDGGDGAGAALLGKHGLRWQTLRVPIGAHEIVTLMLDIEPGRKQWRDLDAKREVWATVHKTGSDGAGDGGRG